LEGHTWKSFGEDVCNGTAEQLAWNRVH
jgi:hypothetical protein